MKSIFIYLVTISFLLLSCKTADPNYKQNLREVKYFQSRIHNIERNIVTLSDGTKWKTNRFVVSVNMTEVFFVVNFLGYGDAYINGTKYSVSHKDGPEGFRYFTGYLNSLKTIDINNRIIELSDKTKWLIIDTGGIDIKQLVSASDLIISEDESIMINPYKIKAIKVKKISNELQKENN